MADPVDVAGDIAADAAGGDDLVGPAREKILDHMTAARQQAMRMAALRHALARNVRQRKRVALQHRDHGIEIRQRPRGEQAAHARADHNRMLANVFHGDAPAHGLTCIRRVPAGTEEASCRLWTGRSHICQRRDETGSLRVREPAPRH